MRTQVVDIFTKYREENALERSKKAKQFVNDKFKVENLRPFNASQFNEVDHDPENECTELEYHPILDKEKSKFYEALLCDKKSKPLSKYSVAELDYASTEEVKNRLKLDELGLVPGYVYEQKGIGMEKIRKKFLKFDEINVEELNKLSENAASLAPVLQNRHINFYDFSMWLRTRYLRNVGTMSRETLVKYFLGQVAEKSVSARQDVIISFDNFWKTKRDCIKGYTEVSRYGNRSKQREYKRVPKVLRIPELLNNKTLRHVFVKHLVKVMCKVLRPFSNGQRIIILNSHIDEFNHGIVLTRENGNGKILLSREYSTDVGETDHVFTRVLRVREFRKLQQFSNDTDLFSWTIREVAYSTDDNPVGEVIWAQNVFKKHFFHVTRLKSKNRIPEVKSFTISGERIL